MKTFMGIAALFTVFAINAFSQRGDPGINPAAVGPPVPGAPPVFPQPDPTPSLGRVGVFGGVKPNTTSTSRIDQSERSCDTMLGQERINCQRKFRTE